MVILKKSVAGLSTSALARFVLRARRAVKLAGQVDVLVTSSAEMRQLNRRFRGKDKPTDVLSFPADGVNPSFAGEIAIAAEIAAQSARGLGHSVANEIKILALHGVLHLAGYDHEIDDGAMSRKESHLRKALRLPDGLIERSETMHAATIPKATRGGRL